MHLNFDPIARAFTLKSGVQRRMKKEKFNIKPAAFT